MIKKLKSQNGASLVLALIFFAACGVFASMILTIARSYEKRIDIESGEAEYLAALSAAEFLKSQLNSCQGTWILNESDIGMKPERENKVQRELLEAFCGFCKTYKNHPAGAKRELGLTITLENDMEQKSVVPEIEVHIRIESDGEAKMSELELPINICATFSLAGKEDRIMKLTVIGTALYEEGKSMELCWEEMFMGR